MGFSSSGKLEGADDVAISNKTDGQTLVYSGATSTWQNQAAPPPADGTITTAKLADGAVSSAKLAGSGGTNGQVIVKDTAVSGGLRWAPANTPGALVPTGGAAGQTLVKNSSSNYDVAWRDMGAPVLVLGATDPVPVGTPIGTVIVRKT